MADLGNIGTTSLLAFSRALNTIANNIANVNTEGYSKQRVNFDTRDSQFFGGFFFGSGVKTGGLQRLTNEFAYAAMLRNSSAKNLHENFYSHSSQIDSLFSQEGTDVSGNLQTVFNALELANDRPDEMAPRINFFEQAQGLVSQFQNLQRILDESYEVFSAELTNLADNMTTIGQSIAAINADILASPGAGEAPELLDQRDELVLELSELVDVETVTLADGTMNVFIGVGETLVAGTTAFAASATTNPTTSEITFNLNQGGGNRDVIDNMRGGQLQGLLDFESNVLGESNRVLGQFAMGFAINFNDQQNDGMDYDGNLGVDIFTDYNNASLRLLRANADVANAGTAALAVDITDVNQVLISDYRLDITGATTADLVRLSDNTVIPVDFAAVGPPPGVVEDGMTITIDSGATVIGDSFNIFPTRDMAGNMSLLTTDSRSLALAAPVRTFEDVANNTGTGEIELIDVAPGAPSLVLTPGVNSFGDTYEIRIVAFDRVANTITYDLVNPPPAGPPGVPPGSGIIVDDAVVAIGDPINIPGPALAPDDFYNVRITGLPNVGDTFSIELNNTGGVVGVGSNFNGLELSGLQNDLLLGNSSQTLFDTYSDLIANIGAQTFRADFLAESSKVLFDQAEAQKLSSTGVNLDEEGANLLHMQRAYQASGQLITISNEIFDILFASLNG